LESISHKISKWKFEGLRFPSVSVFVINRGMTCDPREVSRRYGTEGVIVRRLPQHDNLCPMLAEFVSAVPADILDRLTPVRLLLSAVSLVNRSS
jgi:hypothetical protein